MKVLLIIFILLFNESYCSDDSEESKSSLWIMNLNFNQIKDELNYGLVNNGLNLGIEYLNNRYRSYFGMISASLDLGLNYKKGVGANIILKPIKYKTPYIFTEFNSFSEFNISLYFDAIYNWQMYPELQSGHLFHLSSYEIGIFQYNSFEILDIKLDCFIKSSFLSLNSKKNWDREEQNYSFDFVDFFRVVNQDLNFNLIGNYYHLELWLPFYVINNTSFVYNFEFYYLKDKTDIKIINQGVKIAW